jgi:ABC-2 type transport system ATP-binding protein
MGQTALVTQSEPKPVVQVVDFHKHYHKHPAVQGVNLTIQAGEIYGLIGPDGAGKSSLMKALAGVLTFDAGTVEVFGIKLDSEAAAERIKDRLGFLPQGLGLNLYPDLSVEENINFFARLRLVPEDDLSRRKQRLLATTRLLKFRDRPMKNLSGGMKQKLGLICTLIHEPQLVILDEPTTGVDPVSRRDFWAILNQLLHEQGITALVSTAYLDEASRFHRLSLLYEGRVLAEGEPDTIQALVPGNLVVLQPEQQVEALARLKACFPQVEALGSWMRVFVDGTDLTTPKIYHYHQTSKGMQVIVDGTDPATAIQQVQHTLTGMPVREIYADEPELEDIFIALLHQQQLARHNPVKAASAGATISRQSGNGVAIEALELTRDFGTFRAVDKVSFRVMQGEIFGLLGANGAGKTTVIKMLTGILRPSQGAGHVAGADMRRAGMAIKKRIGYVSQAFSLYQDLTVVENIRLYAGIYGLSMADARQRTEWILEMGGLDGHENDQASSLPMGLRQRLALGCALVHRPQVLFLDEPTSGVDPIGRRQFWDILFELSRNEGVAILITTHYMSEAEHCDHLALMFAGKVVADASPAEMKRQVEVEAGRLLELTVDQPTLAMEQLVAQGFKETALFGRRIHLFSRQPESDRQRIPTLLAAASVEVSSITPRPLSMEDVFVYRVTTLEQQEPSAAGTVQ